MGEATDEILRILKERDVPATFFLLGDKITVHPGQVRAIYEAGHTIGTHSFSHEPSVHESRERVTEELNRTNALIEGLIGRSAVLYRPPFNLGMKPFEVTPPPGSSELWDWVYDAGYVPVGIDLDSDDWMAESFEEVLNEARTAIEQKRGRYYGVDQHVFLLHDDSFTAEALPEILTYIDEAGYEIVPLTRLLGMSYDEAMPVSSRTFEGVVTAIVLHVSRYALMTVLVLSLFAAGLALLRILGFLWFKLAHRKTAVTEAKLLQRFEGTVSVLIPAYNEAKNVRSTLFSILKNTRQPDEIIVIDDGSTDDTLAHARAVADVYPGRILILTKKNGGKASALNYGLTHADGDVVIAIDGDTVLDTHCIDALVRPFVSGRVGAAAGKIMPARAKTLLEKYQYLEYVAGQNIDKEFISWLGAVNIVPGAVGAWRRQALLEVGGYSDDTLVEDQDLTLALLGKNYGVVYVPTALAYTEVPTTIRSFYLQRFRWTFGTFQCLWKYRHYLFNDVTLRLSWISLPYAFTFNILMPVVTLGLNISVIIGVAMGAIHPGLWSLLALTLLDMLYVYVALLDEDPATRPSALHVLLQRFAYLGIYTVVVFLVVLKVLDGSKTRWNKLARLGTAERMFAQKLMNASSVKH
jgi:cellulose synthase/poly-beta-1,6-N-acetylglucosamine synthase-like glycosyltransferase/peptidoglycan/xylan/chitin deacetylase (PgdA/CDA1 family)